MQYIRICTVYNLHRTTAFQYPSVEMQFVRPSTETTSSGHRGKYKAIILISVAFYLPLGEAAKFERNFYCICPLTDFDV